MILESPSRPRLVLEIVVAPRDLIEPALADMVAAPAGRALLAIGCTLLHLYGNPDDLPEARVAIIAPLFDVLLEQEEPRASEDLRTLWTYVAEAFEPGSAVRELLVNAVSPRARDVYAAVIEELGAPRGEPRAP
jgi:hypothetical protein